MAVYNSPARTHKIPVQDANGKWYHSAEAMAKGPKPTPHRDAKSKPTARFLTSSALDALKRIQ